MISIDLRSSRRAGGFFRSAEMLAVVGIASSITGSAYLYYWSHGAILLAGDGVSRLNIARRVVNSLDPGLVQLGAIWPPAPQIAMLPMVWVDPLYRSGIAGSVPSMLAFVGAATYAYLLAKMLTGSRVGGAVAFAVVLFNPNALYLATTPMSEPLLLLTVFASAYHLLAWMRSERLVQLVAAGIWVFISSMTRYEGWSLAAGGGLIVIGYAFGHYRSRRRTEALTLLFLVPAVYGILLWLLYGAIIYGSPFYFATSFGSAKFQTQAAAQHRDLGTLLSPIGSVWTFAGTALDIVGLPFLVLAGAALVVAMLSLVKPHMRDVGGGLTVLFLMLPSLFLVATLFQGTTVIYGIHTPVKGLWNTRYGLNLLPPVAVLCAYPAKLNKYVARCSLLMVAGLTIFVYLSRPPLLGDATIMNSVGVDRSDAWSNENFPVMSGLQPLVLLDVLGSPHDSAQISDAANWMHEHYDGGLILTSAFANDPFIFESDLPSKAFIFEGVKPYWSEDVKAPGTWSRWVVLEPTGHADKVALEALPLVEDSARFHLVFKNDVYEIYEKNGSGPGGGAGRPSCANMRLTQLKFAGDQMLSGGGPFEVNVELTNAGDEMAGSVLLGFAVTEGSEYVSRVDFGNGQPWLVDGEPGGTLYHVGGVRSGDTERIGLHVTPTPAWGGSAADAQIVIQARFADLSCPDAGGAVARVTFTH